MAEIEVSFDTKTKKLEVLINKTVLANVEHINIWRVHDESDEQNFVEVMIEAGHFHSDDDMTSRLIFVSSGSVRAQNALAEGNFIKDANYPGLIGIYVEDQVIKDVEQFFTEN